MVALALLTWKEKTRQGLDIGPTILDKENGHNSFKYVLPREETNIP